MKNIRRNQCILQYLNTVIADDVVCELIQENVVDDVDETRCLVAVTR